MTKADLQKWHERRHEEVTSTFGDLTLEDLIEVQDEMRIDGMPGIWQPNVHDGMGLIACFSKDEDVCDHTGHIVEGKLKMEADHTFVAIDSNRFAMATQQPGSPYLLALYNKKHEAIERFSHIESFDYCEEHIYIGKILTVDEQAFTFQHTGDVKKGLHGEGRKHQSSAIISVDIAQQHYEFRPFASGHLNIIVFRDLSSENDTYPVGRMLVIEPLSDGQVKLDFNKAFLPPCAFSSHFNCPMPPLSNRVQASINAGEKKVIWRR